MSDFEEEVVSIAHAESARQQGLRFSSVRSIALVFSYIVSIPVGIFKANALGPALLGTLQVYTLLEMYLSYTSLGLLKGFIRQVPIAWAEGKRGECITIARISFSWNLITGLFSVLVLWLLYLSHGIGELTFSVTVLLSLIVFLNRLETYLHSWAQAFGEFKALGRFFILTQCSTPFLILCGVLWLQVKGVLLAQCCVSAIGIIYYLVALQDGLRFGLLIRVRKMMELMKIGFMVFINDLIDSLLDKRDLQVLALVLTTKELGLYSFAYSSFTLAVALPGTIDVFLYRHMLVNRGKHGLSNLSSSFMKYFESPLMTYLLLSYTLIGLSYLAFAVIVRLFLSDYMVSLLIMKILILGQMVNSTRTFTKQYFNVSDQLGRRLFMSLSMFIMSFLAMWGVLRLSNWGLFGVAWISTITTSVFAIALLYISISQIYNRSNIPSSFLLRFLAVSILLWATIEVLDSANIISYQTRVKSMTNIISATADLSLKAVVYTIVCFFSYTLIFYEYKLFQEIKRIFVFLRTDLFNL